MSHPDHDFDMDYWDTISQKRKLRLQRHLFRWSIACYNDGHWRSSGSWQPLAYFWKKSSAVAKLVELMLRGHNVQL